MSTVRTFTGILGFLAFGTIGSSLGFTNFESVVVGHLGAFMLMMMLDE